MSRKLITIQAISQKFNISPYTINHYTNLGLLKVIGKRANRRLYDEAQVRDRLAKIPVLKSQGYPLQLITKKLNGDV